MLVAGTILLGVGCGPIGALGTDILVSSAPAERAGAASAVSETATELGGGRWGSPCWAASAPPYNAPRSGSFPTVIAPSTAAASKSTLGGAVDAAGHLRTPIGEGLLHAASVAFTHGFVVAAVAAAGTAAATAAMAAPILRNAGPERATSAGLS